MDISTMYSVDSVHYLRDYLLALRFNDGESFELDFEPMLRDSRGWLYDPLHDLEQFKKVKVDGSSIVFSTGLDICPNLLRSWCESGSIS